MNDLKDLQWQSHGTSAQSSLQSKGAANYNPMYQRHNNPFSQASQGSTSAAPEVRQKQPILQRSGETNEAKNLFGGLVNFGTGAKSDSSKLSLAQQAAALEARKQAHVQSTSAHFAHAAFFEEQLSRSSSTVPDIDSLNNTTPQFVPTRLQKHDTETSDDILAQINGNRPVDKSSFYPPPPSREDSKESWITRVPSERTVPGKLQNGDIDPYDALFSVDPAAVLDNQASTQTADALQGDDILGALGRPVVPLDARDGLATRIPGRSSSFHSSSADSSDDDELQRAKIESLKYTPSSTSTRSTATPIHPQAALIEQIVEMGYTSRQAQAALAQTDTGMNIEEALELLLSLDPKQHVTSDRSVRPPTGRSSTNSPPTQRRDPHDEDNDWVDSTYVLASKTLASANNWFSNKSAMARRKLAEYNANTVAETHASRFDERPKWMRDAEKYERREKGKAKAKEDVDEALREEGLPMHPAERKRLEMNGVLPAAAARRGSAESAKSAKSTNGGAKMIPESLRSLGAHVSGSFASITVPSGGSMIESSRFKANDDEASTYVSSHRRRPGKTTQPQVQDESSVAEKLHATSPIKDKGKGKVAIEQLEEDLFAAPQARRPGPARPNAVAATGEGVLMNPRSDTKGKGKVVLSEDTEEIDLFSVPKERAAKFSGKAVAKQISTGRTARTVRQVPYLDASVLARSTQLRSQGSEAYKRGDFTSALSSYEASLSILPASHPSRILSLTNRAITQIQLGASKFAAADCDEALQIIGSNKGTGEHIEDAGKEIPMTSFWIKAMSRKATALEMQERASAALLVWQDLVQSGLGGPSATQSKQRCESLVLPKVRAAPPKAATPSSAPSQASQAAVQKLRDDDARRAEDDAQKDSLYPVVEGRITSWSAGKEQNLRALLSSLDQILWPTSGWKKITLADLVINAKVKVIYMKALAKVHPDKISRDASIEEKMIAAGVFAKLNKAWDSFKAQNNM